MSRAKVFPWLLLLVILVFGAAAADAAGITKRKNPDGSTHYELIGTPSDAPAEKPAYQGPQRLANDNVVAAPAPVPVPAEQVYERKRQAVRNSKRWGRSSSEED